MKMKRRSLTLLLVMVFLAVSEIMDLAQNFYIWACMREFGFYEVTIPGNIMYNLLGFVTGYPLLIAYVRSVTDDIAFAESRGIEMMAEEVIQMILGKEKAGAENGEGER